MSGPKGGSYRVVSAEELRRRALARARQRLEAARSAHGALRADVEAGRRLYGDRVPAAPGEPTIEDERDPESVEAAARELERRVAAAERPLREVLAECRADAMTAALDLGPVDGSVSAEEVVRAHRRRRETRDERAGEGATDTLVADIARVLRRLDADADEETQVRLASQAEAVVAATSPARAQDLLDLLRDEVMRVSREMRARREREQDLDELESRLHGLDGDEAAAARSTLAAARRSEVALEELRAMVDRVVAAAENAADRAFVLAQATKALASLGYEVDQGFETLVVEDGYAHVRRAAWPGYAVRVRAATDPARLNFNVVRASDREASDQRDLEVEEEWCADLGHLLVDLEGRGVEVRLDRTTPAGAQPVQTVAAEELGGSRRAGGRRRLRERRR